MQFAIELDNGRAARLHATLPEAHVLAPASFFGCQANRNTFSLIWLNPPFDHAYGGYRVEDQFLQRATEWLMPGGVMAFVCPEDVADEYSETRQHFAIYYEKCQILPFPERHRQFKEVIVFGQKRAKPQADRWSAAAWESVQAPEGFIYQIPASAGPRIFRKVEPTEPELQAMLAESSLRTHLTTLPEVPMASPPLALGIGHVALLLASGHLDGVVEPEGQPPHVVRGSSHKHEYVADESETENPDGTTTKKTTLAERIELVVRTIDLTGQIRTFAEANSEED
jgi:hypothetical protein